MRRRIIPLLFIYFISFPIVAQDFDTIAIKRTELAPGMYFLQGWGGNILASTGDDGVFLVDDQMEALAPKIKASLAAVTKQPVKFIFNTHFHYDHSDGNKAYGPAGGIIMAHENSRHRMTSDQLIAYFKREQKAYTGASLPKITFTDSMDLHINGQDIHVMHVAHAHTDGDAMLFFHQANIIHMGDIFVTYGFPFVDVANGGDVRGIVASIDHVLPMLNESTRIVPGHGTVSTKQDLIIYRDMVKTIYDRVCEAVGKGQSLKNIDVPSMVQGYEDVNGIPATDFVMFAYNSILLSQ